MYILVDGNAQTWANQYGITGPVIADASMTIYSQWEVDGYIPSISLVGAGLEVLVVDSMNIMPGQIEQALPESWDSPPEREATN
jgi:hypothetical protein